MSNEYRTFAYNPHSLTLMIERTTVLRVGGRMGNLPHPQPLPAREEGRLYPRDSDSKNGFALKVSSGEPHDEGNKIEMMGTSESSMFMNPILAR